MDLNTPLLKQSPSMERGWKVQPEARISLMIILRTECGWELVMGPMVCRGCRGCRAWTPGDELRRGDAAGLDSTRGSINVKSKESTLGDSDS